MDSYSEAAEYYDRLYDFKDYRGETEKISNLIRERLSKTSVSLLDVACGTGVHVKHFLDNKFCAEGMDLSEALLKRARERNPATNFYCCDMTDFALPRRFDVITVLFSAIGYVKTIEGLRSSAKCLAHHLEPGGLLVVEPWLTPDAWKPGTVHMSTVDEPELKIVRMNTSKSEGKVSVLDLHYLIGTPSETRHLFETHKLGLFSVDEMYTAFQSAGFTVDFDKAGLTGRGLYICRKEYQHA